VLRPATPVTPTEYVEYSAPSLELVYRAGSGDTTVTRPTLRIGLDLFELLARMARGYAPTTAERRGTLVNLLVFRTQLAHEAYDRLILVDNVEQERYRVVRTDGKINLTKEAVTDAAR
jgi:hypothetical protein